MAENLLQKRGAEFEKIFVDTQPERRKEMMELSGRRSVPQIFAGNKHIGGYDDLVDLDMDGELVKLINDDSNVA